MNKILNKTIIHELMTPFNSLFLSCILFTRELLGGIFDLAINNYKKVEVIFMVSYKYNRAKKEVLSLMRSLKTDYYDDFDIIHSLAAQVPIPLGTSIEDVRKQVKYLMTTSLFLSIKPNEIFIFDDCIELKFHPRVHDTVIKKGQYTGLQLKFTKFLDSSGINDVSHVYISLSDSLKGLKDVRADRIKFFSEFNSIHFGLREEEKTEVLNFSKFDELFDSEAFRIFGIR